jgi:hydroxyacylglutathione hydrolase
MYFKQMYDKRLSQYAYLIGCQATGQAIVIDPMRDIDQYYALAESENLEIIAVADTHIHADYISGLREFAEEGITVYASDEGGDDWKYEWLLQGDYSSELLRHGDTFGIGNINFEVMHTPGHTPESLSYLLTDGAAADEPMGIFSGDFVFVGDVGRPDLLETAAGETGAMKPAAKKLYQSIQKFKQLPEYLQVWPGHGSGSACGKAMGAVPESTVGYELRFSGAFNAAGSEQEFVDYILDGQPEPPLYFGRMKTVNKEGPAVLGKLPRPAKVSIDEMTKAGGTIIDTRGKHDFMAGHLTGAQLATLDNNFNTIAGSYIDPDDDLYLIIDEANLEQAVRDLIRVGLDNIKGYVPLSVFNNWDGDLEQTKAINFDELENKRGNGNTQVLDVRKATEYQNGHVPNSIHIAHTRLANHLDELPQDKTLLVHCASGQRASYAAGLLARKGFDIEWVDDAFSNWKESHS